MNCAQCVYDMSLKYLKIGTYARARIVGHLLADWAIAGATLAEEKIRNELSNVCCWVGELIR